MVDPGTEYAPVPLESLAKGRRFERLAFQPHNFYRFSFLCCRSGAFYLRNWHRQWQTRKWAKWNGNPVDSQTFPFAEAEDCGWINNSWKFKGDGRILLRRRPPPPPPLPNLFSKKCGSDLFYWVVDNCHPKGRSEGLEVPPTQPLNEINNHKRFDPPKENVSNIAAICYFSLISMVDAGATFSDIEERHLNRQNPVKPGQAKENK